MQTVAKSLKVTVLLADKIHFKTKIVIRDKGHCIRIKLSIHQGDIKIIGTYVPNNRARKMHEAKPDRIEGRNRQFSNNSCRFL